MHPLKVIPPVLMSIFLLACGGGGGSAPPTLSTTAAGVEGFWSGPSSSGYTINAVILENGEAWGIYSSGSTIYGALYGSTTVTSDAISISGTDFNFLSNKATAGSLSGTYGARTSMSLRSSQGSTVALSYGTSYDTPANLADLAGTYSFTGRSGAYSLVPGSITINSAGTFALAQTGCASSGSLQPRSNGKNIYNITLTSAGANCATGYSTLNGIAYLDKASNPYRILVLALKPDGSDGLIVTGTKQ